MVAEQVNTTCLTDGGGAVPEQAKGTLHTHVTNLDMEKTKRSNVNNIFSEDHLEQLQREHGVCTYKHSLPSLTPVFIL
jgi:hypothetical protein